MGEGKKILGLPLIVWIVAAFFIVSVVVILAVVLTLPENVSCKSEDQKYFVKVVEPPVIESIEPPFVCTRDGARDIVIRGQRFLIYNGNKPSLRIGSETFDMNIDECEVMEVRKQEVQLCKRARLTLPQYALNNTELPEIAVTWPERPAPHPTASVSEEACQSLQTGLLMITPPPSVNATTPSSVCISSPPIEVTIEGDGFMDFGAGRKARLFLHGTEYTNHTVFGGCRNVTVAGTTLQVCTKMVLTVDPASFPLGAVQINITNPTELDCSSSSTNALSIVTPPTVHSSNPNIVCSSNGGTVLLSGSELYATTSIHLVDFAKGVNYTATPALHDNNVLSVNIPPYLLPAGFYNVTASNGPSCSIISSTQVEVRPLLLVLFVDPPIVYNGISVQVTVFTTGLNKAPASVGLTHPNTSEHQGVDFLITENANRIRAVVPAGLSPGNWGISVTSQDGCNFTLSGGVTITDQLNIELQLITPEFAWSQVNTPVTIKANSTGVSFANVPRVYLSRGAQSLNNSVATTVRSVVFVDELTLSAVIPMGVTPDVYDLIVVNPDGTVGFLPKAITITLDPPPQITRIIPTYYTANQIGTGIIYGENFSANSTFTGQCKTSLASLTSQQISVTPTSSVSNTSAQVQFNFAGIVAGSICIVTVTNPDGASFTFSAVSTKSGQSDNIKGWEVSPSSMLEPRRGHGIVAIYPTSASRFMLAIGGDNGTMSDAKTSVEHASIDVFGTLGGWVAFPHNSLASPRTFATVEYVGRFVYVIGGHNGTTAVDTVYRAEVLNPLDVPNVDLEIDLVEESNVTAGLWFYAVSAVFPPTDPSNPSGESLPSDPLPVQVPDLSELNVTTLALAVVTRWQPITGASGYRVYRTPDINMSPATMQLLAEVNTTFYADVGNHTSPTSFPKKVGSLGSWHVVANLTTPRESHASIAVPNPFNSQQHVIYVFGGRDASGTILNSYEFATIDTSLASQPVSAWQRRTHASFDARAEFSVMQLNNIDTAYVPSGQQWFYITGGRTSTGFTSTVLGANITSSLDLFVTTGTCGVSSPCSYSPDRSGACGIQATAILYVFGGSRDALPRTDGVKSTFPDPATATTSMPVTSGFTNLGVNYLSPRRYFDCILEGGLIFVVGGWNGTHTIGGVEHAIQ